MDEAPTRQEVNESASDAVLALSLDVGPAPESDAQAEDQLVGLMDQHERPIYNFLLALLRDPDVAAECTQDTFVRAYENLRKGRPVNTPWLYKVARNRAMDEFRKKRRMASEPEEALERVPVHEKTDLSLAVRQVMEQLPPVDREVLYLFDIAGYKTDEIGAMLGVRGTAIRQRLSRARQKFRLLYGAEP